MDCELALKHMDAYVGGELSPDQVLDFDTHLARCAECAERLEFADRVRNTLRVELQPQTAPVAVRGRVVDALAREQAAGQRSERGASVGLLAIAAVAMLGFLGGNEDAQQAGVSATSSHLFRDVVSRHTEELPREFDTSEPERASSWFRGKLNFRIHSMRFREPEVRLVGVRVSHVGQQRAARMYYSVGQRRMTVVAFEATPEVHRMLAASDTLHRERIGGQQLSYHTIQGYTVPVIESGGVVYAFTGDLDRPSLLRLVASVRMP